MMVPSQLTGRALIKEIQQFLAQLEKAVCESEANSPLTVDKHPVSECADRGCETDMPRQSQYIRQAIHMEEEAARLRRYQELLDKYGPEVIELINLNNRINYMGNAAQAKTTGRNY